MIASAQRCLNLYAEPMPQAQGEPAQFAYYPTPGLRLLGTLPKGPVRAIRQCTTGAVYAVGGDTVYLVHADWSSTALGTITTMRPYPVSMMDNGLTMVIVDGTSGGWTIDLPSNAFAAINDTAFYGADRVDYLDTYLLFNKPGTPQFYSSDSLATTFDSLYFANKESFSDLLVTLAVAKREIWLLGERTTEVWYNAGATDFPFQEIQGVFVDQGCRAKYSVAVFDDGVYWLGYNRAGQGIVLYGAGYLNRRISTFAIENEMATYARIDDAIGFMYSLAGHNYYVLTFPAADRTWVYDIASQQWHEWLWIDDNGEEHRHRANCAYAVNGTVVAGDWQNGNLYAVELSALTDSGQPIKRQRSYPHIINELNRVYYRRFHVDMEHGNPTSTPPAPLITTELSCSFNAPDGTLLQAYHNPSDTNATWTLLSGSAQTQNNQMIGASGGGSGLYRSPPFTVADYTVQYQAIPTRYDLVGVSDIYVLARSTGAGTGYRAEVSADGAQYWLTLGVAGGASTSIAMGTLPSGFYTVTMVLRGNDITLSVQRSDDGLWLDAAGLWGAQQPAITLTDSTYTAAGSVLVGGDWNASNYGYGGGWTLAATCASTDHTSVRKVVASAAGGGGPDSAWVSFICTFDPNYPTEPPATSDPTWTDVVYSQATLAGDPWPGRWSEYYSRPLSAAPGPPPNVAQVPSLLAMDNLYATAVTVRQAADTQIFLMWSDDRGHSYGSPVGQPIGRPGAYLTSPQWQRLGYGRDRVFKLEWSVPVATALQGAFIDVDAQAKS